MAAHEAFTPVRHHGVTKLSPHCFVTSYADHKHNQWSSTQRASACAMHYYFSDREDAVKLLRRRSPLQGLFISFSVASVSSHHCPSPNHLISEMNTSLVLTVLALCMTHVDSVGGTAVITIGPSNSTHANVSTPVTHSNSCECPIPVASTSPTKPLPPPPILGKVKARWTGRPCEGEIYITFLNTTSMPVCFSENITHFGWLELCERRGCGGKLGWKKIPYCQDCYNIGSLDETKSTCDKMAFSCDVEPDTSGQLVGYKVVTCILCLLVFVVLIARFGRPSLKAFRKKMSDKRQSRWIGPTQSQSVSYHRGKTGVQHNDKTEKRSSFPGLERLTVNNSREPSSNRNSDYDSYNL
ncbi:hypothetical protein DPEC_G00185390 [Dallia pectoralis]|uniref:Uncharacterized protein n=1 Tax=Dallia pectoralis TaxID=75939 RepID=A0ACC2GBP0_DALPE|nr:hypothetical protein DPEC_G00185390 [Dallia pectoralis]